MRKRLLVFIVTVVLAGLYSSFLTADIITGDSDNPYSKIVKFVCILICFSLTLAIGKHGHDRRDTLFLRLALFLTVIADFVIGIMGHFMIGIGVFVLVQIVYVIRHSRGLTWTRNEIVSGSFIYGSVCVIFFFLREMLLAAGLFWPALFYTAILSGSLWMAIGTVWRKFYPRTIDWFIVIGMSAFFLCDINAGLFNALKKDGMSLFYGLFALKGEVIGSGHSPVDVAIPYSLRSILGMLVWFFYLPAQFLLSLSGYRVNFLRSVYPLIPDLPEPDDE
jgi:hypothetical protein